MKLMLVDVETTGVGLQDKVCEIAWAHLDTEDLSVLDSGQSLINPGIPIKAGAGAINGITDAMVADAPTLDEYIIDVGNPFMTSDLVLCAHSLSFDYRFLKRYVHEDTKHLCTLKLARKLYPEAENHKQATLAYMFGLTLDRSKAHSADGDLSVLRQLLQRIVTDSGKNIDELLELVEQPENSDTMPFGKHKGKKFTDLPKSYVAWLLNLDNLSDDLRKSLKEI